MQKDVAGVFVVRYLFVSDNFGTMGFLQPPAHVRKIKDIDLSKDVRVRILGSVSAISKGSFYIEDDTGRVEVLCEPDILSVLYDGQTVRIYAQVIPSGEGIKLRAEIVQDATGININLYKIAEKMWIKYEN